MACEPGEAVRSEVCITRSCTSMQNLSAPGGPASTVSTLALQGKVSCWTLQDLIILATRCCSSAAISASVKASDTPCEKRSAPELPDTGLCRRGCGTKTWIWHAMGMWSSHPPFDFCHRRCSCKGGRASAQGSKTLPQCTSENFPSSWPTPEQLLLVRHNRRRGLKSIANLLQFLFPGLL